MNKKRKIVKFIILSCFIFCLIYLTGCNNSNNNIFNVLESNISKVEQTLENVQTIDTSDLIIDDFMKENELYEINTDDYKFNSNSDHLNNYVSKISILNNNVYTTIKLNEEVTSSKSNILTECAQIKLMLKNCDSSKITSNANKALKDINKNLMENNTRVSLTRNEINNYLASVKKLKESYNKKTDQLNSRYAKLKNGLNTRNTYYSNILYDLEQISYILCDEWDVENVDNQKLKSKKTWINKNIDTYDNAGKNFFGLPNRQTPNVYNNYYGYPNGYGIGIYNGYGNMYGGYGMNIPPYAYGWGYRMPNINTYGGYRNIDTYRQFKRKDQYVFDDDIENSDIIQEYNEPVKNPNALPIINKKDKIKQFESETQSLDNFNPNKKPKPVPLDDDSSEVFVNKNV